MAKKVVKKAKPSAKAAKPKAKKAPAKPAKKVVKPAAKKASKPVKKVSKPVAKKPVPKAKKAVKPVAKKPAVKAKKVVKPVKAAKPAKKVIAKKLIKAAPKAVKKVAPAKKTDTKVVSKSKVEVKKVVSKPEPKAKVVKPEIKAPEPKAKGPALPQGEMEIKKAPTRSPKASSQESNILNRPVDLSKLNLSAEALPTNKVIEPAKTIKHIQTDKRSRYSDEELGEFKDIILKKLNEAQKDYDILKDTLSHKDDHGTDDTSPTFKLLEDGSDVLSKEETAQLAARQQKFIESLENALIRVENKTYGICRVTGHLISKDRLRSVPHATLSIEAKLEQNSR